jgi:putative transposase
MPRASRIVCAGVPHHVTQRGNRRTKVFFSDLDRLSYLALLREYTALHGVEVLAYCLMPNHVHLVLVPATTHGLHRALKPVHMRHAQRLNQRHDWIGHLWQGRFFSSPLDEAYLWAAIRYVELNPVRAGIALRAGDYRWSSAMARCRSFLDPNVTTNPAWQRRFTAVGDWGAWLGCGLDGQAVQTLRKQSQSGQPCGTDDFIEELERSTGRSLRERPVGRPSREIG